MPRFVKAASIDEVKEQRGLRVELHGKELAIFKRGTEYFAIGNVCAHQHFSVLHEGHLDGLTVQCPMHGWKYDLRTGRSVEGSGRVPRYVVEIRGTDLYIEMDDE